MRAEFWEASVRAVWTGAAAVLVVLTATAAHADGSAEKAAEKSTDAADKWTFSLGAGVFVTPDYVGSDDYEVKPFPLVRVQNGNLYIKTDGPGVRANVIPHDRFELGPIVQYGHGRSDVEDAAVDRLPEIDDELWIGAFAGFAVPAIFSPYDKLGFSVEALESASGDNGMTVKFGTEFAMQTSERLSFSVGLSATYANSEYADTYFSVTSAGAAASGLSAFDAGSGMRDVSLSLSGRYAVTPAVSLGAKAGVMHLLGDFADSPVVKDRGTANPVFGGVFVSYGF